MSQTLIIKPRKFIPSKTLVTRNPVRNEQKLGYLEQRCLICSGSKINEVVCRNCNKPIVLRCVTCLRKSWAENENSCKCGT